jgi:serine/threonine protein kinase
LLDTLRDIHKAGILHDDVRLLNLCSTASGEAFIIDFSHARFSTSESTMADELDDLCDILQMELPRSDPEVQPSTAGPKRIARPNKAERARQKKGEHPQSKKAKSPQPKKAKSDIQTSPQVAQRRSARRKGTA